LTAVNKENLKISYEIEDILDQIKQAEQRQKGLFITAGGDASLTKQP